MNNVLLVAPHWHPRLTFIAKHAEYIGHDLAGIVTNHDPPTLETYNCSVFDLSIPSLSLYEKIIRRFHGYPHNTCAHLIRRFDKVLKSLNPDVVLFEFATMSACFSGDCYRLGIPYVIHYHGFDIAKAYSDAHYKLQFLLNAKNAMSNIANSLRTKERLMELGVSEDLISLKYMGVFIPKEPTPLPKVKHLQIVHLGSFSKVKNPMATIKAFEWALKKGLQATLTMAGDGQLKEIAVRYITANNIAGIRILPTIEHSAVTDLLKMSHLLTQHSVLTSSAEQETFGVSLAEAMAYSRAVVVSDHGSFRELVTNNKTGILFPEHDWRAQGEAFLELDRNRQKLQYFGIAGYARARKLFSEERESMELRKILNI